jgi:steroid 5-alpha reductase family enzyme
MIALIVAVTLGLMAAMMLAWLIQRLTRNAGWVDVVWTIALGAAGVCYALFPLAGRPPGARQWLVAAVFAAWSLRLGLHIAERTARGPEDSRYARFRHDWGTAFERRMFGFLQVQGAAAALLAVSVLLAARNPRSMGAADAVALLVVLVAIVGEATADRQLRRFRHQCDRHDGLCDIGLWGWSRHPNYFFEWLGWIAYPLFAIDPFGGNPWGWFALTAPVFMYWLLVHVSGIPPLEQQMARSRGAAFQRYQARVSAFFPLPPGRHQ